MLTTEHAKKIKDLVEALRDADEDLAGFAWGTTCSQSLSKELEEAVDKALEALDTFLTALVVGGE